MGDSSLFLSGCNISGLSEQPCDNGTRREDEAALPRHDLALPLALRTPEFSMYLNAIAEVLRVGLERQKTRRIVKGDAVTT